MDNEKVLDWKKVRNESTILPNVRRIKNVGHERNLATRFPNLTHLHMSRFWRDRLHGLTGLKKLEELCLGQRFNKHIESSDVRDLTNLKKISFGEKFDQSIDFLKDLKALESVTLGGFRFNQSMEVLKNLPNLTYLAFGQVRTGNIDFLGKSKNFTNLTHLLFGPHFNRPIDALKTLENLTFINFGQYFNQSIEPLKGLIKLTHLNFTWRGVFRIPLEGIGDSNFNQSIDSLENLSNLKFLCFGSEFNQPINKGLKNLLTLTHLSFGKKFNQSIDVLKDLNLTYLEFDSYPCKFEPWIPISNSIAIHVNLSHG